MSVQVGKAAPDFNTKALVGREFQDISLKQYTDADKWVVLFFYPKDFTFVCPTELVEFNSKVDEFEDRDVVVLGGSTDSEFSHLGWVKSHNDLSDLQYPLFADIKKEMATAYGVLDEDEGVALRGTFVIDPNGVVQWAQINSMNVGRNVDEVIRVIDALQTDELCPCNWKKGEQTIQL